jgi:hypothetical protein
MPPFRLLYLVFLLQCLIVGLGVREGSTEQDATNDRQVEDFPRNRSTIAQR